ncbi:hypothetical protein rosmuc_00329 [Roseovarius mucosus DSM 17069]|uniref:Deacetylase n=1 Tax=Roseovarius mucosus DSM 17069 TaxID=1288298 RepID=A0A0A0HR11_9RHOB|nr:hypothetical protein rosmuc_00329 [Roseovarius mucosus DSM 17069]
MTTALITHPDCLGHETPEGHPEQVARLERILEALEGKDVILVKAPLVAEDDLLRVHPKSHVEAIRAASPASGAGAARCRYLDVAWHAGGGASRGGRRCARR